MEVVTYPDTGDRLMERYHPGYEGRVQVGIEAELLRKPLSWKAWIGHPLSSTRRPQRGGDHLQFQLGLYRFGKKEYQRAAEAFLDLLMRFEDSPLRNRALYWLAESQYGSGQWEEAKKTHRILLRESPEPLLQSAVLVSLGWMSQRTGGLDDALGYYRRFLDEHPQSPAIPLVVFRLGEVLYSLKMFDSAAEQFQRLSLEFTAFTAQSRALFLRAESLRLSGAHERARERYREYLRRYPGGALAEAALYGMGWSSAGKGRFGDSADIFQKVVARYPEGSLADEAGILAGWSLLKAGTYDEALETFESHGEMYPHSPWEEQRSYFQAMSEYHAGRPGDAGKRFARLAVEAEDPSIRRRSRFMEGAAFAGSGNYAAAAKRLEPVEGGRGDEAEDREALLMAGWSAYRGGEQEKAESLLGRYLRRGPTGEEEAEGLYWLGMVQAAQGKDAQAALSFARSLALMPGGRGRDDAVFALAEAYYRLEKWGEAGRNYRVLLEGPQESPLRGAAMLSLADCLVKEGKGKEALKLLERSLDEYPASPRAVKARYLMGEVYLKGEEYERAQAEFARLIDESPSGEYADDARFHMAWIHYREGRFEEALQGFSELMRRHPRSDLAPMALLRVADARYRLRNYPEALAAYGRILLEHPDSSLAPTAEYGIGLTTLAQGSFDDYARVSLDFVKKYPAHSLAPAVLSQLGRQYLLRGRYGSAEKVLARLMTDYPGEVSAPETMIKAARADRTIESRREEETRLGGKLRVASSSLKAEYIFDLANLYLEEGDCRGALAEYRSILEQYPGHPVAPFALLDSAGCHAGEGRSLEAREAYRILTRDYGDSKLLPGILYRWGLLSLEAGEYEAAAGLFRRIGEGAGRPLEAGAAFGLGLTQQKRGMTDEALGSFLVSMRLDPGGLFSRRAALGAADAARHLGRRQEALRLYGLIIEEGAEAELVKLAREGVANMESGREAPAKEPVRP